jgi:sugar phosphate isomerase/epimerase
MKFGFSTNAFVKKNLTYAIKSIAKLDYDGVEVVVDSPHMFLPLIKSKKEKIKKQLKYYNLEVTNLNVNTTVGWYAGKPITDQFEPSLSNRNDRLRRWRINYTKQAIDLAVELNSPNICITSGSKNRNNTIEFFKCSLQEICDYSENKKISVAIEYEPGLLIGNAKDVFNLITDFKNIGLNLDICHAKVLNENVEKIIKKFNRKIYHTHISDCKNNVHYHLIPGLGEIDFKLVFRSLKQINYNGYLTAELYTYSNKPEFAAKQSINYLKKLIDTR